MFSKNKKEEKALKPQEISGKLARLIGEEWGKVPQSGDHWVKYLAVSRPQASNPDVKDVRVFDEWSAAHKNVKIKDYASLDDAPDLILMEGWYDTKSGKAEIKAKAA
jgi:hypothetical protein